MISTIYQPYVAMILFLTGIGIYALSTITTSLSRRIPAKWLKVVLDVVVVIVSYLIVAVVVYIYDYGRLRLYTPLCVVSGMLISRLVKKICVRIAKSPKSR